MATILWQNSAPEQTQIWKFMQIVNIKYEKNFDSYQALYRWTIENIAEAWEQIWAFCGIRHSQGYERIISDATTMFPRPKWFEGAKLNFAENLLYPTQLVEDDAIALICATERNQEHVTWSQLRERVRHCQNGLVATNLQPGDVVAGYTANSSNALVAMLATTSLGAIWTAISPDAGVTAVVDKLSQIRPDVMFCDNAVLYGGKVYSAFPKLQAIVEALPSLRKVVLFETIEGETDRVVLANSTVYQTHERFLTSVANEIGPLIFRQLDPDHPLYILYSSGTTGPPKCIIHGALGTLLQHKKEHILQSDIRSGDRLFYYTTCTWMMWHWLMSGLASGATLVLYDGSPFHSEQSGSVVKDDLALLKMIDQFAITHFGTSAKYLSVLEQASIMPKDSGLHFSSLKAIYSTGSPLAPSTFQYVYRAFGELNLASITGGTDIISLFGAPSPISPVYAGEIQTLGLGMAVQAWSPDGTDVSKTAIAGDLVCVRPFPSQPIGFWGQNGQSKYYSSYFSRFQGVWHHGDFIKFNPLTHGLIMLGRSDGTLKPSGVRFGSAEIYNILLKHFAESVEDSICVGRRREQDSDETVVLFLKMMGDLLLSDELVRDIKSTIRQELSARHVPGIIAQCPAIPVTANGKKVESTVKQIISGSGSMTSTSIVNSECLGWFTDWAAQS